MSSFTEATKCWCNINEQHIERILCPVDLEELRLAIFRAYLDQIILFRTLTPTNLDAIRKSSVCAMELMMHLPPTESTLYAKHVIAIAKHMLNNNNNTEEALHYFKIALHCLQTLSKNIQSSSIKKSIRDDGATAIDTSDSKVDQIEVNALIIKTQLGLAFCFRELK